MHHRDRVLWPSCSRGLRMSEALRNFKGAAAATRTDSASAVPIDSTKDLEVAQLRDGVPVVEGVSSGDREGTTTRLDSPTCTAPLEINSVKGLEAAQLGDEVPRVEGTSPGDLEGPTTHLDSPTYTAPLEINSVEGLEAAQLGDEVPRVEGTRSEEHTSELQSR